MEAKKAYIFGAIFLLSNRLQNAGDKLFEEISTKQWLLLISMIQSGVKNPTLTEVSNIMGYTRQNVKKLAIHLESEGFVELQKDSADSRVLRILITEKCFEYFKARQRKDEEFIENLYDGLTDDEISAMFSAMEKLRNNIFKFDQKGDISYEKEKKA